MDAAPLKTGRDTKLSPFSVNRVANLSSPEYSSSAVIGGCSGTSNVLTGEMFGVPVLGTHAHSWIMSFPSELEAFRAYAKLYPNNCTLLVDTYDVLGSGVPNAIRVFSEMRDAGLPLKKYGIRIDSGDLAYISKKA